MAARILTALVLIPLVSGLIWFNPTGWAYPAFVALLVAGLIFEYAALVNERGAELGRFDVILIAGVSAGWVFTATFFQESGAMDGGLFALLAFGGFLAPILHGRVQNATIHAAAVALGGVYLGWCFGHHAILLRNLDGAQWLFTLLGSVWVCDSAAFFAGKAFGKHRLSPNISPAKTWEGSIAGFFGATLAGTVLGHFLTDGGAAHGAAVGSIVGVVGQLSDLAESLLKRDANVKDSGALLPGHGGVLDRLDSLIFATPAVYYYLLVFARVP